MSGDLVDEAQGPKIVLRQLAAIRIGATQDWSVEWEVENQGDDRLRILTARLPHGQFKSKELRFEPPIALAARAQVNFRVSVRCNEPSGVVTENAFVIFQVIWSGEPWRIFARIRVIVTHDERLETATESITTQRVGFSGVST